MNLKTFGRFFLPSFIVAFLYQIASYYFYNYESGHQSIPDINGGVIQVAGNAYQEWFIKSLVSEIWPLLFGTAIYTFWFGFILYFLSRRNKKAQDTLGKNIVGMSLRPSIVKIVSTLIIAPISYYGLLIISFLGFGNISAVVWIIARVVRIVFALPQIIVNSFGIRFNMFETSASPYVAMIIHVIWIYLLVCFVSYLITLKKFGRQTQIDTIPSVPVS